MDALPGIVKQVNGRCEVFVDGGISRGTDILKVLALGARMVMREKFFDFFVAVVKQIKWL